MSLTTALTFGLTLVYPPSMIERIARLRHYEIDEKGIKYLRKVTIIWFSFCILNAVVSLWTLNLDNMQIWVLYNGVISYILMGLLLVGEIIYRHLVYNKHYQ
ncbi:MAG: Clp protease [Chlamydiales bacterium]|nr:Clp protease [Chlamydiales bacterium]